jgi:hypothetical protein
LGVVGELVGRDLLDDDERRLTVIVLLEFSQGAW